MDKVRVYELARDLGMTSPETIRLLKEKLDIRVKSASSTVDEDAAIKLKRLIRLQDTGALATPELEEVKVETPASLDREQQARAAARRRAARARQALLEEMEEEERQRERRRQEQEREERERKEREEAERIAAERAAQEEAAREAAAAEAAREAELEREAAEREEEAEPVEAVGEAAAIEEAERRPPTGAEPEEGRPVEEPVEAKPPVEAERREVAGEEAPAEAEERAAAPTAPSPETARPRVPPAATEVRGERPAPQPARPGFVPGPTSTYIRPRPARPAAPKPSPPPPRPAAPIKTVPRRPTEVKPPKTKERKRAPREVAADTKELVKEQVLPEPRAAERKPEAPKVYRKITLTEGVTVKELAEKLDAKHKDVIKALMGKGVLATINQTLGADLAKDIAREFGADAEILSFEEDVLREEAVEERPEDLESRAPVVTVMGHVDHGKTSLLDAIRETKVVEKEAGGITQHIGAYKVDIKDRSIVFLDTPGHEAFTMMRARGARVTDLVVLVVAADDGVMPQTVEAINHARAAGVPLLVAVNKIDKPEANPDRVKKQLADLGLMPEDWGGNTVFCEVSAKKRQGLDLLLEMILLVSDLQELKANPARAATGTVLEAKIDKGKGPVAHVLVQNGSVQVGDSFIAGAVYGKIRAMFDDRGRRVKRVGPASPVEILGLTALPQAGDPFQGIADSLKARQIGEFRQQQLREQQLARSSRLTLDQLHQQVKEGTIKELPIVLKADVQGSVEVLKETLTKLSTERVKIRIIHASAGAITDTDVMLASASNAVIIGFNVRPQRSAEELAERENIDIRLHTVIYAVTDEIKKAMEGLLEPTLKETVLGRAEVRDTFRVPRVGTVAGCYVTEGRVLRNADVRLLRDNVVIYEGRVGSLKRFKEDATEVKQGFECGIGLTNYNDIKVGDVLEVYTVEKVQPAAVQ